MRANKEALRLPELPVLLRMLGVGSCPCSTPAVGWTGMGGSLRARRMLLSMLKSVLGMGGCCCSSP
eukprot:518872-Alexandrium_andersonii.AAC.1